MEFKDYLIKEIATDMQLPEDLVFKVIAFQGEDALKHTKIVNEIEFSGFGKFMISKIKVKRIIGKYEKCLLEDNDEERTEYLTKELNYYKSKL